MIKLGDKEIDTKIVLAPMAGFTSFAYRKFMSEFGIKITYTEMVSDLGLIYKNEETLSYLSFPKEEFLTGLQLFGNTPKNIAKAAQIALNLNKNIDFIDVNMCCPVPKVTKQGSGSALMKNPKLCGEIISILKKTIPLPITAKIRLGFDNKNINFLEVIEELENSGVDLIAIHARSAKELYMGTPHFDLLKDLRKKMHVPLVISGNIFTVEEAIKALEITGADAVMIARGGLGNPSLITDLNNYFKTGKIISSYSLIKQKEYCLKLAKYLIDEKGEKVAMRIYRSIAPKFFSNIPNIKSIRLELSSNLNTYEDLVKIVEKI